jgi:RNA polymerase primary sigma factor
MKSRSKKTHSILEQYAREISSIPLLTRQEELELATAVVDGCRAARDKLIRSNLRLVVAFARRFSGRGVEIEEVIAAGNLGLIRGVEAFDPARGCRFSTYGGLWILQSMKKAVDELAPRLRVPAYMTNLLSQWKKAETSLRDSLERQPTDFEIARRAGISPKKVAGIKAGLIAFRLDGTYASGFDDGATESVEGLADQSEDSADRLERLEIHQSVERIMSQLTEDRRHIIELSYGLSGNPGMSDRNLASTLNISVKAFRAMQRESLELLRTVLGEGGSPAV